MKMVTAVEAQDKFDELLHRVEAGEEIVITRNERAVARMVPQDRHLKESVLKKRKRAAADLRALRQRIAERTAGRPDLQFTDEEIISAIEEGRP